MKVRRVVTGRDGRGRSGFVQDTEVEGITVSMLPGMEFHRLWGADDASSLPGDGSEPSGPNYFPPAGGFRFGMFTVPGETVAALPEDLESALGEIEARLPGLVAHMEPENPGMHTTATVDYIYVVSGNVTLELDEGRTVDLGPGDTVIQNGTRHAWHNRHPEPAVMVVAMVGTDAFGQ